MKIIFSNQIRENLPFFLNHYFALSSDDRYMRFFHTMTPSAIRDWLLSYDNIDNPVKTFFIVNQEETGEFSGIVQISTQKHQIDTCEIAISVIPSFQRKGLAKTLISRSLELLKALDFKEVLFSCDLQNITCRTLMEGQGFTGKYNFDEQCYNGKLKIGAMV